ncbi:MAG TPA: hypothetical protein VFW40_08975 [Capsulimonadaceae bacterium]|nr:hypothetical protein [Capsulimonadaceae bacterium]
MIVFLLILSVAMTWYVVRRTGYLSPAGFACIFSLASMLFFCWIGLLGGYRVYPAGGLSFKLNDYSDVALRVLLCYTIYLLVVGLSTIGLSKDKTVDQSSIEKARTLLKKVFDSNGAVVFAFFLAFLSLCHYFILFIDPYPADLPNKAVTKLCGYICAAAACVIVYCWSPRKYLAVFIASLVLVAEYQFVLRDYSRWCPVIVAVFGLIMASRRKSAGKSIVSFGTVFCALLSLYLYMFVLQFKFYRIEQPGLDFVLPQLMKVEISGNSLCQVVINLLQGPLVLAEAIRMSPVDYTTKYRVLSFSPLISAIDHFNRILYQEWRVNSHTPFNNFAELYNFGLRYIVFYAVMTFISMRQVTSIYLRFGPLYGFLLVAPIYDPIVILHQYEIRTAFRKIIYTALLSHIIATELFKTVRTHARQSRAFYNRSQVIARRMELIEQANRLASQGSAQE